MQMQSQNIIYDNPNNYHYAPPQNNVYQQNVPSYYVAPNPIIQANPYPTQNSQIYQQRQPDNITMQSASEGVNPYLRWYK